jgi:hypothetical protein
VFDESSGLLSCTCCKTASGQCSGSSIQWWVGGEVPGMNGGLVVGCSDDQAFYGSASVINFNGELVCDNGTGVVGR